MSDKIEAAACDLYIPADGLVKMTPRLKRIYKNDGRPWPYRETDWDHVTRHDVLTLLMGQGFDASCDAEGDIISIRYDGPDHKPRKAMAALLMDHARTGSWIEWHDEYGNVWRDLATKDEGTVILHPHIEWTMR